MNLNLMYILFNRFFYFYFFQIFIYYNFSIYNSLILLINLLKYKLSKSINFHKYIPHKLLKIP